MRRHDEYALLAVIFLAVPRMATAQKVDLPNCDRSGDAKVTTFTVDIPVPPARAQSRVLRVFTLLGLPPSSAATLSNQVTWDSGNATNIWTGDDRRRRITATLMDGETDGTTTVLITPWEANLNEGQESVQPLSNKNGGYGGKVWCAARAVADSLRAWADRQKPAAVKADTTQR